MAVNKVIYGGNTLVDLTGDTVTAADLADGVKATGADGNPIVGIMQKVTIDAELSTTSTNPVQNRVIKEALDGKLGKNETAAAAVKDGAGNTISTTYASKTDVSALLSTKLGVTATAYAATRDGAGNNIAETYAKKTDISGMVKSVNGTKPDTSGNVSINVSGGGGGGVSTSEVNTWTAEQIFNDVMISGLEKSEPVILNGNSITPTSGHTIWMTEVYASSSLCTLNLDGLLAETNKILRFEIVLVVNNPIVPTLKIISTNNIYMIVCPENTGCSALFDIIHGMVVNVDGETIVFIKIDNFTQDGVNISS